MRARPVARPRFSTATTMRAAFRPRSCRLPRKPLGYLQSRRRPIPLPAQRLAGQVDHGLPQLVQDHPRCLVTSQTQLALQEKRRDAAFIRGHEVGRPEPNGQRRFRVMQNRSCVRTLDTTTRALPALRFHDWVRIPVPAPRADEAVRPAALSQILLASFFGREHRLELAQGFFANAGAACPYTTNWAC